LVLLDRIDALLSPSPASAADSASMSNALIFTPADIFIKLSQLVDAQAVLAFWIRCLPGTAPTPATAIAATAAAAVPADLRALGASTAIRRYFHYHPRADTL